MQVPPRFELGSLDSESRVLTITPWGRIWMNRENFTFSHREAFINDYIRYQKKWNKKCMTIIAKNHKNLELRRLENYVQSFPAGLHSNL